MADRPDEYYVGRLLGQIRLLIATNDDIPVETKLETQPMLKTLEATLADASDEADKDRARGQYAFLCEALEEHADLDALLRALRNFVPYL